MIVFEITGQLQYMLPVLVAVRISYGLGSTLTMSVYDVMMNMKGLPYLPSLRSLQLYNKVAQDIMETDFYYLTS